MKMEMFDYKPHDFRLSEEVLSEIRGECLGHVAVEVAEKRGNVYVLDYAICPMIGEVVRNHIDIDYTTGGNPGRYRYVPSDELWIEDFFSNAEFAAVFVHEFIETLLMQIEKMNYDDAHDEANRQEKKFRAWLLRGVVETREQGIELAVDWLHSIGLDKLVKRASISLLSLSP